MNSGVQSKTYTDDTNQKFELNVTQELPERKTIQRNFMKEDESNLQEDHLNHSVENFEESISCNEKLEQGKYYENRKENDEEATILETQTVEDAYIDMIQNRNNVEMVSK